MHILHQFRHAEVWVWERTVSVNNSRDSFIKYLPKTPVVSAAGHQFSAILPALPPITSLRGSQ